ncbi:hypothetical protein [Nocardia yamanashiensis]|uniref:hypothetical protein n=1 Tax=Nocardia yamanashiensis TaxID=209247 RepID=UPI000AE23F48|nr:hypothetical protein [Nocardia yamanashiensis]
MTKRLTSVALSMLPIALVMSQGVSAAAPGQPGLAVPGEGQPGLTTENQPAANTPSPADYIPDPPIPAPSRPRPSQQTNPQMDTYVQPKQPEQSAGEETQPEAPAENAPAVLSTDPHKLRVGTNSVELPDFVDKKTRDKAQAYVDMAEWQIAAAYDRMGFSQNESDRLAASSFGGAGLGLAAGGIATVALVPIGCGVGAAVGAVAGGLIGGIPTAGVGAPAGALIGGVTGCLTGAAVVGIPAVGITGTFGAILAGALGGGDATKPQPANPESIDHPGVVNASATINPAPAQVSAPIVEAVAQLAPAPVAQVIEPVAEQVYTAVDNFATQVNQVVEQQVVPVVQQAVQDASATVDSFRTAVENMPALTPEAFLAAIAPAPGA